VEGKTAANEERWALVFAAFSFIRSFFCIVLPFVDKATLGESGK